MVELLDVSLFYGNGAEGLNDVSLRIPDGEFCFITGRSGSGKSTFSKLLTGELLPSAGSIKVNGYNMARLRKKKKAQARRTIGMVFQDFRLIPSMTVGENLEFAMKCIGASSACIYDRIDEVLALVDLSGKEDCLPSELSGGEQQRVAIARAIINKPSLIIADEPTGNLDSELAEEIMRLFVNINKLGTTTIVITHAKELIAKFPARTIELENGKIKSDTVKEACL